MNYSTFDLTVLDSGYFNIIKKTKRVLTIVSISTNDTWQITNSDNLFVIHHMPKNQNRYHRQGAFISLKDCFLEIANHDDFVKNGRTYFEGLSFFDTILDIYEKQPQNVTA